MTRNTRPISWIKAAEKDFLKFPDAVQRQGRQSLTILAEGQMPDNTKSLKGLGQVFKKLLSAMQAARFGWFMC